MIKKLLLLIILVHSSLAAQNLELKNRVKELQETVDAIEQMNQMYEVQLRIVPSESAPTVTNDFSFTKTKQPQTLDQIKSLLSNKSIGVEVIAPYSLITIFGLSAYDWTEMLGVEPFYWDKHPEDFPVVQLEKVYFTDGSSQTAQEIEQLDAQDLFTKPESNFANASFVVSTTKAIASIDYNVVVPLSSYTTLQFSSQDSIAFLAKEKIQLTLWNDKEIGFVLPVSVLDAVLGIDAIDGQGRYLTEKGSNSSSFPSERKRNQLNELSLFYTKAIAMVRKKRLKSAQELDAYLAENSPIIDDLSPNNSLKNYHFSASPSEVRLYVKDKNSSTTSMTINNTPTTTYSTPKNRRVATDYATHKKGILNEKGHWLIQPTYFSIYNSNDYFFSVKNAATSSIENYWLSVDGEKWKNIGTIDTYRQEMYGSFLIVENKVNGPKGIFNITTGELVVPTIHDNIYESEGLFIVRDDETYTVLDHQAHPLIARGFSRITIDLPFIYALPHHANAFTGYQIYTKKGKQIGQDYLCDGTPNAGDDLVLVYQQNKEQSHRRYYYLDTTGRVAIAQDPKTYEKAERFVHQRALWKLKDGAYGYVDTKGKIAIPFMYTNANNFRDQYALVQYTKNSNQTWIGLIDRNGKEHVRFAQWPYYISYDKDQKTWIYVIDDQTIYNGEGQLIKN